MKMKLSERLAAIAAIMLTTTISAFSQVSREYGVLLDYFNKNAISAYIEPGNDWTGLPSYGDRAGWDELFGPDKEWVIKTGEQCLDYQWSYIPATAYLEFERSGDRSVMQTPDQLDLVAASRLLAAELAEGKGRFIDQLANAAWHATEKTSWVLSAHVPNQRSGRSLPDGREVTIDLGSARMGALVSMIHYFFHDEFDKLDPSISLAVERAVRHHILDPYLGEEYTRLWWTGMTGRETQLNNWTPWCTSNVLICFLAMEKDRERLLQAVRQSVMSVDKYLDYVQADGGCDEGPAYWAEAFGKAYDYLQIMYDATGGHFNLFNNERFRRMAEFPSRCYVGGGYTVSFADSHPHFSTPPSVLWNCGRAFGSQELKDLAILRLSDGDSFQYPHSVTVEVYRSIFYLKYAAQMRADVDHANAMVKNSSMQETLKKLRSSSAVSTWYPETQFCFLRGAGEWFLGAKAGFNNESHNHNDVGNFVLFVRNTPVFVDAGVGTYTRQTFSAERYSIWTMVSQWHNLPAINGANQVEGQSYRASDVVCNLDKGQFSLDMSGAYADSASCNSWKRSYELSLKGEPSLIIKDSYSLSGRTQADVEHFLVKGEVETGDGWLIVHADNGVTVKMTYPRGLKVTVETRPLEDMSLITDWGCEKLQRISLSSSTNAPLRGSYVFKIAEVKD